MINCFIFREKQEVFEALCSSRRRMSAVAVTIHQTCKDSKSQPNKDIHGVFFCKLVRWRVALNKESYS